MGSENNVKLKLAAIEALEVKINHYSKKLEKVKGHYQFFFQKNNTTNYFKYSPTLATININIAGLGLLLGELKSENIDKEKLDEILDQAMTLEGVIKKSLSELHVENDHMKYETSKQYITAGGVRRHKQKKSSTHKRTLRSRTHKRTHKRLTASKSYIMISK
jgi:hypothetical protein